MRVTDQVTTQRTGGVDAATLRNWAWRLSVYHKNLLVADGTTFRFTGSLLADRLSDLEAEIRATADAAKQEEAAFADYLDECESDQPDPQHEFGCECGACNRVNVRIAS